MRHQSLEWAERMRPLVGWHRYAGVDAAAGYEGHAGAEVIP
jgi:hypothetical protein